MVLFDFGVCVCVCVCLCSGVHITHCLDCCMPARAAWVLMTQTLNINSKKLTFFPSVIFTPNLCVFFGVYCFNTTVPLQ